MHEQANMLDDIGEIRLCECEVLEGSGEATILGGIGEGLVIRTGELGASANGRGGGMAVEHVSPSVNGRGGGRHDRAPQIFHAHGIVCT